MGCLSTERCLEDWAMKPRSVRFWELTVITPWLQFEQEMLALLSFHQPPVRALPEKARP
jgi:hypothetical protein